MVRGHGVNIKTHAAGLVLFGIVIAVEVGIGSAAAGNARVGAALALLVLIAASTVIEPSAALIAVLPLSYFHQRFGPSDLNLSLADGSLLVATPIALIMVKWRSPAEKAVIKGIAIMQALLLVAVLAHPARRGIFEWLHRLVLTTGSIGVGLALVQRRRLHLALQGFVAVSLVFAFESIKYTLAHHLVAAYPFGLHKNSAGFGLALAAMVVARGWALVRLPSPLRLPLVLVLVGGLAATQSRGSAIALLVALLVTWPGAAARILRVGTATAASLAAVVTAFVVLGSNRQLGDNRFGSVSSRQLTFRFTIDRWLERPFTGLGLRFWADPAFTSRYRVGIETFGEPHNMVISALGESGLFGLAGVLIFLVATATAVRLSKSRFGALALGVLALRVVSTEFDIFWVAGGFTAPFVIIGSCLAISQTPASTPAAEGTGTQGRFATRSR